MKRLLHTALFLLLAAPVAVFAAIPVKVMVLTAFPPELAPWVKHMHDPALVKVAGAYAPVWCEKDGVCVTETGEAQVNSATTVAALLASPQLDLKQALFLRAGIAGGPPWGNDTLGGAYWANWVVSWDLGHHLTALSHDAPEPLFLPLGNDHPPLGTHAFELNPRLVKPAYHVTRHTRLADDASAIADRKLYPTQTGRTPNVAIGATITGDDYWSGVALSRVAQRIVSHYSHGEAHYATTAMEDTGDAGALARRGLLSHYLSLRTISDFDQPPAGQTAAAMLLSHQYPGGHIAFENAYRVGMAFVDYVLAHPAQMAKIYAADTVPTVHYPLTAAAAMGK
ncbi:hypothetical protein [Acidihalobacter ferrooxydans]|uniref:Purine nucleoside permease n=1 Tax=Acidihalobacter ferrooxydans TaxID=1765967 RepID=A0A1P8UHE2_9GAMM|nr:hypothetical protein [Acidihalobacter ferrooxydans]APZ43266.1 hypothetical protein BW247_09310 [Acidihalobacter ferrooxydans]